MPQIFDPTTILAGWSPPQDRLAEREWVRAWIPRVLAGPERALHRDETWRDPETRDRRLTHELFRWTGFGATGKTDIRYVSAGVRDHPGPVTVEHEHVYTLRSLKRRLVAGEDIDDVLQDAIACLVTPDEHRRLRRYDRSATGWERYDRAGIRVWDRVTGDWLDVADGALRGGPNRTASVGDLIGCAARHIEEYCADLSYAWPAYDEDPHPTRLTALDLLAPELLSAGVSWREALPMANHANNEYGQLWDAMCAVVEDGAAHKVVFEDIDNLDGDKSWAHVRHAFVCCQDTAAIKTTKVSKILHRKLPQLVPINDRLVRRFYGVSNGHTWSLWPRLHDDINRHRDLIDGLRAGRSTPGGRPMTRLRCADIVVWMHERSGCDGRR
jgi:hypothetical protein